MRIWSDSFTDGGDIPAACAFAVADPDTHVKLSSNRNPHIGWDDVPAGTQSLVLVCHDPDVPSDGSAVNQEGRSVPATLARVDFFHWTLVDIPIYLKSLAEGMFSNMVTPHGKPGPVVAFTIKNGTEHQLRHGMNGFTGWFASDPAMAGEFYGYDGPYPPWNDERVHHYVFTLYALDIPYLPLPDRFTGADVCMAIRGHILDEARIFGIYTLNPALDPAIAADLQP